MTTELDRPAYEYPELRRAVAGVLKGTSVDHALSHHDMSELITRLLDLDADAYLGVFALADVLIAAGVERDYAAELARPIGKAVLDAALTLRGA
jgi:hypothetical protein